MNNVEINAILKHHYRTRNMFLGCTSSDMIPHSQLYPYSAVVNTDDSSGAGIHWVCIHVPNADTIEYFDSYAMEPPSGDISNYLSKFTYVVKNTQQLQHLLSSTCGHYCVYFLIRRSSGASFHAIVNDLMKRGPKRDVFVRSFVERLL